jgi:asparagine synthetase B (glutamine-hydrolysing)
MCGIGCILDSNNFCHLSNSSSNGVGISESDIQVVIRNRGPNSLNTITRNGCSFIGSVLHIQGPKLIDQPYISSDGDVLLWNGEVFSTDSFEIGLSDTVQISKLLNKEIKSTIERDGSKHTDTFDRSELLLSVVQSVTKSLSHINGPYAFIYYHKSLEIIIYGRDPFGRRSLLTLKENGCTIALSSVWATSSDCNGDTDVSDDNRLKWEEIPVTGIFGCSVQKKENENLHLFPGGIVDLPEKNNLFAPWPSSRIKLGRRLTFSDSSIDLKIDNTIDPFVTSSSLLLDTLLNAVRCRVSSMGFDSTSMISHNVVSAKSNLVLSDLSNQIEEIHLSTHQCRVGVLFSGGIDSVVLAALLHLSLPSSDEPIDLLNVAFTGKENSIAISDNTGGIEEGAISAGIEPLNDEEDVLDQPAPDRLAAVAALGELQNLYPKREWRLVHVDVTSQERQKHEEQIKNLIRPRNTHMDLNIGTALWFASRGQGYLRNYTKEEISSASTTKDSAGRPLVRAGGDEFARSVGLLTWKQKNQNNQISSALNNDKDVFTDRKNVEKKESMKGLDLKCANLECRLQSKASCIRNLCKRCCNQSERDTKGSFAVSPLQNSLGEVVQRASQSVASEDISLKSSSFPTGNISSNSSSGSSAISFSSQVDDISDGKSDGNDMVAPICPVHKSSARELEKMRSNEKRMAERRQGMKVCLSCEKMNAGLECKRDCPGRKDFVKCTNTSASFAVVEVKDTFTHNGVKTVDEVITVTLDDKNNDNKKTRKCNQTIVKKAYTTTCRALLIGIGADEQMVIQVINFSIFICLYEPIYNLY